MVARYPPPALCQAKKTPPGPWGLFKVNNCLLVLILIDLVLKLTVVHNCIDDSSDFAGTHVKLE